MNEIEVLVLIGMRDKITQNELVQRVKENLDYLMTKSGGASNLLKDFVT